MTSSFLDFNDFIAFHFPCYAPLSPVWSPFLLISEFSENGSQVDIGILWRYEEICNSIVLSSPGRVD